MSLVQEWIVDAHGCSSNLDNLLALSDACRAGAEKVGARVVKVSSHQFHPHGVTITLILQESHIVLSTWPEYDLAIVNIFLCNPKMNPGDCWSVLETVLKPKRTTVHRVDHQVSALPIAA